MELRASGPRATPRRVAAALLFALALAACSGGAAEELGGPPKPPPHVETVAVELRPVAVREDYAGRIHAVREVEVRARVDGIIEKRHYVEGQFVREGDPLFRIDPEPFEAALAQAQAERQRARANLRQAELDWKRISALYEQDVASTRDRDAALSELELAQAELALAEARVRSAEIDLGYTTVTSPASGITSLEVLPEGALAGRGDLLTTVTQLDPVHVRFALPEEDAIVQREARRAMAAGEDANGKRSATLLLPDGAPYPHEGVVDFTEASIDPATGTVRTRAVFPNPEHLLTPGLFVRVQMETAALADVAVIPERAVTSSGRGPAVFVVRADGTVELRPVELGPVVPEGQVVRAGLAAGERVAVSGLAHLDDGIKVVVDGEVRAVQGAG